MAFAAGVQAVAALFIAWYTVRLTHATDRYAKAADDQVREAVQLRRDQLTPFVVPLDEHHSNTGTPPFIPLVNRGLTSWANQRFLRLLNVGAGPALEVAMKVVPWYALPEDQLRSYGFPYNDAGSIPPGDSTIPVRLIGDDGLALEQDFKLEIEYTSIDRRHIVTKTRWDSGHWVDIEHTKLDQRASRSGPRSAI